MLGGTMVVPMDQTIPANVDLNGVGVQTPTASDLRPLTM